MSAVANGVICRLLKCNFYNVKVILLTRSDSIVLFTGQYKCGKCSLSGENVKILSTCDNSTILRFGRHSPENLDELWHNFNECSLKVGVRKWEPYVQISKNGTLYGIDINLIGFVAESFNLVPEYNIQIQTDNHLILTERYFCFIFVMPKK